MEVFEKQSTLKRILSQELWSLKEGREGREQEIDWERENSRETERSYVEVFEKLDQTNADLAKLIVLGEKLVGMVQEKKGQGKGQHEQGDAVYCRQAGCVGGRRSQAGGLPKNSHETPSPPPEDDWHITPLTLQEGGVDFKVSKEAIPTS